MWLSRLVAMLALLFLAMLVWQLDRLAQPEESKAKRDPRLPDMLIEKGQATRFGPDGQVLYRLYAPQMQHFPEQDSTLIQSPVMEIYRPGDPKMVITAERARGINRASEVHLQGKVRFERASSAKDPSLVVLTTEVVVYPDSRLARSSAPVQASMGMNQLTATGFVLDYTLQKLNLLSDVRMSYVPAPSSR